MSKPAVGAYSAFSGSLPVSKAAVVQSSPNFSTQIKKNAKTLSPPL
jgi:hypothetical protein